MSHLSSSMFRIQLLYYHLPLFQLLPLISASLVLPFLRLASPSLLLSLFFSVFPSVPPLSRPLSWNPSSTPRLPFCLHCSTFSMPLSPSPFSSIHRFFVTSDQLLSPLPTFILRILSVLSHGTTSAAFQRHN